METNGDFSESSLLFWRYYSCLDVRFAELPIFRCVMKMQLLRNDIWFMMHIEVLGQTASKYAFYVSWFLLYNNMNSIEQKDNF